MTQLLMGNIKLKRVGNINSGILEIVFVAWVAPATVAMRVLLL